MTIDVAEDSVLELRHIYEPVRIARDKGALVVAMRNDGIELHIIGSKIWYEVNFATGKLEELSR